MLITGVRENSPNISWSRGRAILGLLVVVQGGLDIVLGRLLFVLKWLDELSKLGSCGGCNISGCHVVDGEFGAISC